MGLDSRWLLFGGPSDINDGVGRGFRLFLAVFCTRCIHVGSEDSEYMQLVPLLSHLRHVGLSPEHFVLDPRHAVHER